MYSNTTKKLKESYSHFGSVFTACRTGLLLQVFSAHVLSSNFHPTSAHEFSFRVACCGKLDPNKATAFACVDVGEQ